MAFFMLYQYGWHLQIKLMKFINKKVDLIIEIKIILHLIDFYLGISFAIKIIPDQVLNDISDLEIIIGPFQKSLMYIPEFKFIEILQ